MYNLKFSPVFGANRGNAAAAAAGVDRDFNDSLI